MKSNIKKFERVPVEIPEIHASNFSRKLRKDNEQILKRLRKGTFRSKQTVHFLKK